MRNRYLKKWMLLCSMLIISAMAFAQNGSITGKIVDETNQPMPAATIAVQGSQKSTSSDANGNYKISGLNNGTITLEFRFLGYVTVTRTVTLNGSAVVNVGLQPNTKSLNEVVVIGYGTQSKKDVSGAITTVSSKDFQTGTVTSPEQLIQGKVAGVSVTSNGAPGSGSAIRIRGGASLSASNDPLIVIDGVPLSNNGISGAASALSLINADDIESETILKDAASTAIYGSRASNGVILITTKKGSKGSMAINVNQETSIGTTAKTIQVLTADQVRAYVAANKPSLSATLGSANTDWQKQIYQNAFASNTNLSFSGSTKILPYRLSLGYLDQDGLLKTDNIKRSSAALRLNPSLLHNSLKIDLNVNGTYQHSRFANTGAIGAALSFDPTQPVYDSKSPYNGYYESYNTPGSVASGLNPNTPRNPVALINDNHNTSDVYRSFGNLMLNYQFPFLKALSANANFGYDVSKGSGRTEVPASAAQSFTSLGNSTPYLQKNTNKTIEYYLNYTSDLKSIKSTVNAQAGYGYYDFLTTTYNYQPLSANGKPMPNTTAPLYPYGQGQYTLISYYGRLIYTYNDRFTVQGSIRTDGSSKFAKDNRWGVFPAAAVSYRLTEEDFLKDSKVISDMKIRLGYGVTGQQDGIPYYSYIPSYSLTTNDTQYQFGNTFYNGYTPSAYDTSLKWETTNTFDGGVDFGFLNQRIYGSVDVYVRKTKDLLSRVPIPAGTNFTNYLTTNVGNTNSSGIELNLNAVPVKTKDISWTVNYNIAFNSVKITNLYLVPDPSSVGVPTGGISGGTGNYVQLHALNHTPYSFYLYKQIIGSNGKPLEGVYADNNADGTVTATDEYLYHASAPPVTMGFSTSFSYKHWSLSTVLRANLGNYVYNNVDANLATGGSIINNIGVVNNATTGIYASGFTGYNYLSDYWVQNASFLRMDNVGLGYTFGKFNNKHLGSLRITANCQNVFVITNYTGLDPEVFSGIDNNTYPRPRTYTLGINLGIK
ncbi:SusC/RagA family protein [Mucilaginibacter sp. PPCGB 2223]|uniref:SusC/RagA family TonB-linked outer membrane protein n=1 Tax=Mucilaginibacter sp. PPCGB 2223 TaxID=1886027 RepID=UPI000825A063|nr:SusC/RagA family TonB-linked outer membrane protein [Mucilaginibacter sp. PPCGB 2223]OCX52080.1 SusC/RagA family protein [Mucilaginibacter sp. PPCGB 2223]